MKIKNDYSENTEYEIKTVEPYTVQEVLDLLSESKAWTTPLCVPPHDGSYVQTVVDEKSITIAYLKQIKVDFTNKWSVE